MSEKSTDVIVLGAGVVGTSTAWHLNERGKQVVLVDRRAPGEETSHGNAGVVEMDGFEPVSFPTALSALLRYGLNREVELHYHLAHLPKVLPWLWKLKLASSAAAMDRYAHAFETLQRHSVSEHRHIARLGGSEHLFRDTGWLRLYRSAQSFAATARQRRFADQYGRGYEVLGPGEVADIEPHLAGVFHKAIWWKDSQSVANPGAVTKAIAASFVARGGRLVRGDGLSARQVDGGNWQVETDAGTLTAPDLVVALGPWSMELLAPLGYRAPFVIKRGYHRHFAARGNATLSRPVVDNDRGYVITPMEGGIRLTSGIEFAAADAAPTPVQIDRALPFARALFPLAEALDAEPWMGRRPCFPDSLPVLGGVPRHRGLWLNFGHGHSGFALGPVTGRLVAEMMTGAGPLADPAPFAFERFA